MSKIKIYSKYDVPGRVPVLLESGSNVDKDSGIFTDINYIVNRYLESGDPSTFPIRSNYNKPIYGDFSKSYTIADVINLRDAMIDLYDDLPDSERVKYKNVNDFMIAVGSASDEQLVSILDYNTSSPVSAPVNTGAEASGSVQSGTISEGV